MRNFCNNVARAAARRHLPLIGYCILALGVAGAIAQEHAHANQERRDVAAATRKVLAYNCARENELRRVGRNLILTEIPQLQQQIKHGTLTASQGASAILFTTQEAETLRAINCAKVLQGVK